MSFFDLGGKPKRKKKEPNYAEESMNNFKNAYQMGKNVYNSPAASFIKKKIADRQRKQSYKGYVSTKINLGSAPVGYLKPTKKELAQLKGNSRIRYY